MTNLKMCKNFLPILIIGCLCVSVTLILFSEPFLVYGQTNENLSAIPKANQSMPEVVNETIHYSGYDYPLSIKSWNGMIKDFSFDKERQMFSWSVPFDLSSTRLQDIIGHTGSNQGGGSVLMLRQDLVVPRVFPLLGMLSTKYETPVGMLNGFFLFSN